MRVPASEFGAIWFLQAPVVGAIVNIKMQTVGKAHICHFLHCIKWSKIPRRILNLLIFV